jgi:hypothetical protein
MTLNHDRRLVDQTARIGYMFDEWVDVIWALDP